jgi:hypothetical protein
MHNNQYYIMDDDHQIHTTTDIEKWAKWMEGDDNRRVALSKIGDVEISTVFLSIDHNFGDGAPVLFETMAFDRSDGKWDEIEANRYSTYDEALEGHNQMVIEMINRARAGLLTPGAAAAVGRESAGEQAP